MRLDQLIFKKKTPTSSCFREVGLETGFLFNLIIMMNGVLVKLFISHFCSVVECLLFTAPYSLILKLITQQMVSYFNVIN